MSVSREIGLASEVVDDVMELECRTKLIMAPALLSLFPKNLFLIFFCFSSEKFCFERTYLLHIQIANYYSCFNKIVLHVQICIIQPTIVSSLKMQIIANVAPGFYFAIQLGIQGARHVIFFYLIIIASSSRDVPELSLFQDVLGD